MMRGEVKMIGLMVTQIWAESIVVGTLVEPEIGATWVAATHVVEIIVYDFEFGSKFIDLCIFEILPH